MNSSNERESGDLHYHGEPRPRSSSRAKLQTVACDDEMEYESCKSNADLEEVEEREQEIKVHPKKSYI
jgi:hypothetical protein